MSLVIIFSPIYVYINKYTNLFTQSLNSPQVSYLSPNLNLKISKLLIARLATALRVYVGENGSWQKDLFWGERKKRKC